MNILAWILIGSLLGCLACVFVKTNALQGMQSNVAAGAFGAMIAGGLLTPPASAGLFDPASFSFPALLASMLGAAVLLVLFNLLHRGNSVP